METKANNFLDNISIARKTAILITVITAGVLFLGSLGYLSLHQFKKGFDNFYDSNFESIVKLDEVRYSYNTAQRDKAMKIWREYKKIDPKLKEEDRVELNRVVKSIEESILFQKTTGKEFNQNLTKLKDIYIKKAKSDREFLHKKYSTTTWLIVGLTIFLLIFSILFTHVIVKNTKKMIYTLSNIVRSKISDYESLAHNYEDKVTKEVIRNREKDQIMYQHARLASMGEMIGNIAHQWRQPLNALTILIQGFGTKSMTGKLDQEFIDKQVSEGLRLANQMSNTIEDFRNFFSPHRQREYFSIEKSLKDTLELVEFFCKDEHISIEVQSREDLRVFGYSNEFSQVILNLINNARDNFKYREINDERKILIKLEKRLRPKPYAIISFIDNGGGIDDKIKDRIFEPYFTTKHKSTGTGIGLYMSKQIIEKQMQGLVTVKNVKSTLGGSKTYRCAQFIIAIPIK